VLPGSGGTGPGRAAAKSINGDAAGDGVNEIAGAIGLDASLAGAGLAGCVAGWIRASSKCGAGTGVESETEIVARRWIVGREAWDEADVGAGDNGSECGVPPNRSPREISDSPI